MTELSPIVTGGSTGAIITALIIVGRFFLGAAKERRENSQDKSEQTSARVRDKSTEFAILDGQMKAVDRENERLRKVNEEQGQKITALQDAVTERDRRIDTLMRRIDEMRDELMDMSEQLRRLKEA